MSVLAGQRPYELPEPLRQPLRVNRTAELVGKDEVLIDVGGAGEGTLGHLNVAVLAQNAHGLLVERRGAP